MKRPISFYSGKAKEDVYSYGGGTQLAIRTTYSLAQRTALHALAESNPTPHTYARERARILANT